MRLLVDTHIVLWRLTANQRLPAQAVDLMDDEGNSVEVSAVSVWEVAVKHALGRKGQNAISMSGTAFLDELRKAGIAPIPITAEHASRIDELPLHHRDPFDRMLVAQAKSEPMVLLTHDTTLAAYGDCVLVV